MTYAQIITKDLRLAGVYAAVDYSIELDIDYRGKSTITIHTETDIPEDGYIALIKGGSIIYLGLIADQEGDRTKESVTITCREIQAALDRKVIESGWDRAGTCIETFAKSMIEEFFADDDMTALPIASIQTPTTTMAKTPPDTTDGGIFNLLTWLGNMNERSRVACRMSLAKAGIAIALERDDAQPLKIDHRITDIVDQTEKFSIDALARLIAIWHENERVEYYLTTDRTVTTDKTAANRASGSTDIIYTQAESLEELAEEALVCFRSNSYQHSVEMDIVINSPIYRWQDFFVGRRVQLQTKTMGVKETIITGLSYQKGSPVFHIKFGNLPVTLTEKLKGGM